MTTTDKSGYASLRPDLTVAEFEALQAAMTSWIDWKTDLKNHEKCRAFILKADSFFTILAKDLISEQEKR